MTFVAHGDSLLSQQLVAPLHETDEDGWIGKRRVLAFEIRFEDPTGPRARPSDVDRDLFGDHFLQHFSKRRPAAAMGIAGTLSEIRPDNIEELASYLKQMSSQISS